RQCVLEFRTWRTNTCNINGLEAVDAALDEHALTPVQHLLAKADRREMAVDIPVAIDEGIKNVDIVVKLVLGIRVQIPELQVIFGIDEVVKRRRAHEEAVILPATLNINRRLKRLVDEVPLVEVQVAVIGIDASRASITINTTAIRRRGNLRAIPSTRAQPDTGRHRSINLYIEIAKHERSRRSGRRKQKRRSKRYGNCRCPLPIFTRNRFVRHRGHSCRYYHF